MLVWLIGLLFVLQQSFWGAGREQSPGLNRFVWMWVAAAMVMAWALPWSSQSVVLVMVLIGISRSVQPSAMLVFLMMVLATCGAYLGLRQVATVAWVEPFLWMLVIVGLCTTAWGSITAYCRNQPYRLSLRIPWTRIEVSLGEMGEQSHVTCGHLNANYTRLIAWIAWAAAFGLAVHGHILAMVALVPITWLVYWLAVSKRRNPGSIRLYGLLLAWLGVAYLIPFPHTFTYIVASMVGAGWYVWRQWRAHQFVKWHDTGRITEWLRVMGWWWQESTRRAMAPFTEPTSDKAHRIILRLRRVNWYNLLLGMGPRSWLHVSSSLCDERLAKDPKADFKMFGMAHNEYIQQVFEYGVIGGIALMVLVGQVLYHAYQLHVGLFLVAYLLACSALMTFPWAFYHEVRVPRRRAEDGQLMFSSSEHGNPLLFVISMVVIVLASL